MIMLNKNNQIWILIALLFPIICGLSGCTHNINATENINKSLTREFINSKLEPQKINLLSESKCSETIPINVINVETRKDQYIILDRGNLIMYILPIEFIDRVIEYTKERLIENHFIVTKDLGKKIYISLDEVKIEGSFSKEGIVKLRLQIPEINYLKAYSGKDGSASGELAVAYAAHHAITSFMNDPVFQKYVKCQ